MFIKYNSTFVFLQIAKNISIYLSKLLPFCAIICAQTYKKEKKMKKSLIAMLALAGALNAAPVAVVNGESIDDAIFGPNPAELKQMPADARKRLIDSAIDRKLVLMEAKKEKVENSKEYKTLAQLAEENVLIQLWEKKQFDAIKISDAEAQNFYNQNKNQFVVPAQVRAKHILVQSKAEADAIIKELSALKGEALSAKFSEIAAAKSIDKGSAAAGGELGWFPKTQMVPAFGDAAFALKNGEMTKKAVQSQFGYHIIYKQDSKAQQTLTFDRVKDNIIGNLKAQKLQGDLAKKVENLRKNAKIEYK